LAQPFCGCIGNRVRVAHPVCDEITLVDAGP